MEKQINTIYITMDKLKGCDIVKSTTLQEDSAKEK